ncbi:DNA-directed RNA polymerase subunit alpha [Patescibacteria group bacterium]|nr:DNA-directed RNA polymerase subunit alpha [Patescibacteria group bacterium]
MDYEIVLPMKPRAVLEDGAKGTYEIDCIYAGYGYTLGNALRRIILSSLPGAAITTVKIGGVSHEFSTLPGVKEDVITILLNLKRMRFKLMGDEPQKATLSMRGQKKIAAGDFKIPSQLVILNKDQEVATLADKKSKIDIEITVEKGLGYIPREILKKEKVETGILMLDAVFTPVRRVNYEVENMRVGERTDFNRLRFFIETDGSITPREALEDSIKILIRQLSAIVEMSEKEVEEIIEETKLKQKELEESRKVKQRVHLKEESMREDAEMQSETKKEEPEEFLKTRIEDLNLSGRTMNALSKAGIRTVGGLTRKKEEDLLKIGGLGDKALNEIRRALGNFGLILK